MLTQIFQTAAFGCLILTLGCVVFTVIAGMGRRRTIAGVLILAFFGATFFLAGLSMLAAHSEPSKIEGAIFFTAIQQLHRGHRTEVDIRATSETSLTLFALGSSKFFHRGERARVQYLQPSGEILSAEFFTADGQKEGSYLSSSVVGPYVFLCAGVGIGYMWWTIYRRIRKKEAEGSSSTNSDAGV